jgi:DNA-binding MarR family transcriptional regulator
MSLYDKKDLQILEMIFYAEQPIGFSAIMKETKISRSALARHLNYLSKKIHYIDKVPDGKTRFLVYKLTEEGTHGIVNVLGMKRGIAFYPPVGKSSPSCPIPFDDLSEKDFEILKKMLKESRKRREAKS